MNQLKPTAPIALNDTKPKTLRAEKKELSQLESEKLRLKKATKEFESFFMASMLKSMRQTVPKGEQKGAIGDSGLGKDIFQSMFDEELSKKMAAGSKGGLGDLLYQNLVKRVEAEYSSAPGKDESQTSPTAGKAADLKEVTQRPKQE